MVSRFRSYILTGLFLVLARGVTGQPGIPQLEVKYLEEGKQYEFSTPLQSGKYFHRDHEFQVTYQDSGFSVVLIPKGRIQLSAVSAAIPLQDETPQRMLCNGIQSWSISSVFDIGDKLRKPNPLIRPFSRYYGDWEYKRRGKGKKDANLIPRKARLWSWNHTWITFGNDRVCFAGSLNESFAYTVFYLSEDRNQLILSKDVNGRMLERETKLLDIFTQWGNGENPAAQFGQKLKGDTLSPPPQVQGWTSWYNYYADIDEEIILRNLGHFAEEKIPITFFQIDDGYQEHTGDWLHVNEKFPRGMKYIADSIHRCGYQAGIWIAPFVVSGKSRIFRDHPDWLLRDEEGKPIVAGINPNWDGKYYALNTRHPWVRAHLKYVLRTICQDWGFDLVKVDFLFAASMVPRPDMTRAESMADAIGLLREGAGSGKLLGCGTPLGPGYSQFEYCRIGPDIHLNWEFGVLKLLHARERPSVWGSLQNALNRWFLDGAVFGSDPDVFILRDEHQKLSWEQKRTLFLLNNLLGSLVFTSDDISSWDEQAQMLYATSFPVMDRKVEAVTEVAPGFFDLSVTSGGRKYRVFVNLDADPRQYRLPAEDWWFHKETLSLRKGGELRRLAPYSTEVFLRESHPDGVRILGAPEEFLPGESIVSLQPSGANSFEFEWKGEGKYSFTILSTDGSPVRLNGEEISFQRSGNFYFGKFEGVNP